MDCIFCKIVNKELPAEVVYEDEHTLAFLDINPTNEGHTLVIPKKHSANLLDMDEEDFAHVSKTVHRLAPKIKQATGACGINVIMNVEPCAGQVVMHPHVHIIPRFENDGLEIWHGKPYESEEKMKKIAEKIKSA